MQMTYSERDGVLFPEIELPKGEQIHVGKYGMLHKTYLRQHRSGTYSALILKGKLNQYLTEIDATARARVEQIVSEMAKNEGVNEELKAKDQMRWVGLMNNLKNAAEETVMRELIYN